MSEPIPAATVVIFRERGDGPPELLMVERAKAMAFAGGALVFPGGRIDPEDRSFAGMIPGAPQDGAARLAAIRETIEEAGIAIGLTTMPDRDGIAAVRSRLHAGQGLAAALGEASLVPDLDALVPFARWLPAHRHARVFDTHFYLARLPEDAPEPEVDATENVRVFWATPQDTLAAADAGEATIIFPTRRNLERLALFGSFDDAVAHARSYPIRAITPWVQERDGMAHLCIDDDLGYPITSEPLTSSLRG